MAILIPDLKEAIEREKNRMRERERERCLTVQMKSELPSKTHVLGNSP